MKCFALSAISFLTGCSAFLVDPPHTNKSNIETAGINSSADFLIETEDLIDRDHPIGRIGDYFFGGQYEVSLSESLHDYFEAEVVRSLQEKGYKCFRTPGEFTIARLKGEKKPLIINLELQDLTLTRHQKVEYAADHVVGVCRIRGVIRDAEANVLHQRQFVGKVDTYRLTDELTPPFIGGWISRGGLSILLEKLLEDTIMKFKKQGVPEIDVILREYRSGKWDKKESDKESGEKIEDKKADEKEEPEHFDF